MSAEESPPMAGRLKLLKFFGTTCPSEVLFEHQCPGRACTARCFSANRTMAGNGHEWLNIELVFHGTTCTASSVKHNAVLSCLRCTYSHVPFHQMGVRATPLRWQATAFSSRCSVPHRKPPRIEGVGLTDHGLPAPRFIVQWYRKACAQGRTDFDASMRLTWQEIRIES